MLSEMALRAALGASKIKGNQIFGRLCCSELRAIFATVQGLRSLGSIDQRRAGAGLLPES